MVEPEAKYECARCGLVFTAPYIWTVESYVQSYDEMDYVVRGHYCKDCCNFLFRGKKESPKDGNSNCSE